MSRIYTNKGQGISTKLVSLVDGKKYIISTATDPRGGWQLAVFRSILGFPNPFKPLRVNTSRTFEEAERKHFETEELVANSPQDMWRNWS
jgi:hypothetical protein